MGKVIYLGLCLLGCLIFNPLVEAQEDPDGEVAGKARCDGFLYYGGNCYRCVDHPASWEDAEIECQDLGKDSFLASVETLREDRIISSYCKRQISANNLWIGLHAVPSRSKVIWEWSDGTAYRYASTLWDGRTPTTYLHSSECIALNNIQNPSSNPRWQQYSCSNHFPYVCKWKA